MLRRCSAYSRSLSRCRLRLRSLSRNWYHACSLASQSQAQRGSHRRVGISEWGGGRLGLGHGSDQVQDRTYHVHVRGRHGGKRVSDSPLRSTHVVCRPGVEAGSGTRAGETGGRCRVWRKCGRRWWLARRWSREPLAGPDENRDQIGRQDFLCLVALHWRATARPHRHCHYRFH